MLAIFLFVLPIFSITPEDIFNGEWDVHAGSDSDHEVSIKYSYEFHLNKTSGRTISTIWHSNIVSKTVPAPDIEPMIAQFEISFAKNSANDHSINFKLKLLENDQYDTKIDVDFLNLYVSLHIVKSKTMEISIGPLSNDKNQIAEASFIAYKALPVKLVKILPMFREYDDDKISSRNTPQEYVLPKTGATFTDYVQYIKSKCIRYFYLYRLQIYTVLFIIVVQLFAFILIRFIQNVCSRAKGQQNDQNKDDDETIVILQKKKHLFCQNIFILSKMLPRWQKMYRLQNF